MFSGYGLSEVGVHDEGGKVVEVRGTEEEFQLRVETQTHKQRCEGNLTLKRGRRGYEREAECGALHYDVAQRGSRRQRGEVEG